MGRLFFLSTKAKSGGSLCLFVELLANGASRMGRILLDLPSHHLTSLSLQNTHLARIAAPSLLLIVFRSSPALNTGQQIVMETPASRDPGAGALVTRSASSSATAALSLSRFVSKVNCSQGGSVSYGWVHNDHCRIPHHHHLTPIPILNDRCESL